MCFDMKKMPKGKKIKITDVTAIQRLHKSQKTVTHLFVTAKKLLQNEKNIFCTPEMALFNVTIL